MSERGDEQERGRERERGGEAREVTTTAAHCEQRHERQRRELGPAGDGDRRAGGPGTPNAEQCGDKGRRDK